MKNILLIVCGCMVMLSCNNGLDSIDNGIKYPDINDRKVSNKITLEDIQFYMEKSSPIASRNGGNGEIKVITLQNDTVMYLLKYNSGWEVMPSDKRFPLCVAYNNESEFNYANMHDAQRAWFDNLAKDIYFVKKYGGNSENEHCKVWNHLLNSKSIEKRNSRSLMDDEVEEPGGWMLHNTRVQENILEQNHLLFTHWSQCMGFDIFDLPDYNMYCPPRSTGEGNCPVGCAAVAAGQVLYYLHSIWGVPANMVTTATYNQSDKKYIFSGWSNSKWANIDNNDIESIALLLGHVGTLCDMQYNDDSSGTNTYEKLPDVLDAYGIGYSKKQSWDESIIRNNISMDKPVIGRITGVGENGKNAKHVLVIDGYRYVCTTYTDVYIYVDDYNSYPGDIYDHFESDDPFPEEGPTLEETYNVNVMYYMINWGYGETDNTYYVSYHPLNYTYNNDYGTVPYKDGKQMFYDFYIK